MAEYLSPYALVTADDDPDFRAMVQDMLCVNGPFELVGSAKNGREAVDIALEKRPRLVLMDLQMPGMDGLEATRLIKQRQPEMNVIIVSFLHGHQFEEMARNAGADAYLTKTQLSPEKVLELLPVMTAQRIEGVRDHVSQLKADPAGKRSDPVRRGHWHLGTDLSYHRPEPDRCPERR